VPPIDLRPEALIPQTVEAAVEFCYAGLTDKERGVLRQQWGGLSGKLFTLGQAMIEKWQLEDDATPLYVDCRTRFRLGNSDDVVALILNAVDAKIQGNEFFRLEDRAAVLRFFWYTEQLDPAKRHRALVQEAQKIFQDNVTVKGPNGRRLS
jgi:hypothetical protein